MNTLEPAQTKRDELLEIGSNLFYEQGYHRTGVKQIIDAAGIAKGTFYSHFKSKEDLALAWLKARHSNWNRWMTDHMNQAGGTPADRILSLFDFLEEWMQSCDFRGCAFLNTLSETPEKASPLRVEIQLHKRGILATVRGLVEAQFPERSEDEITATSRVIFMLFEGALVQMQNFRETWPAQAARIHVATLLA